MGWGGVPGNCRMPVGFPSWPFCPSCGPTWVPGFRPNPIFLSRDVLQLSCRDCLTGYAACAAATGKAGGAGGAPLRGKWWACVTCAARTAVTDRLTRTCALRLSHCPTAPALSPTVLIHLHRCQGPPPLASLGGTRITGEGRRVGGDRLTGLDHVPCAPAGTVDGKTQNTHTHTRIGEPGGPPIHRSLV